MLLQDGGATLEKLHTLRKLGVRISMDDFGTGYSSLSYLRSFPFDKIKIDRSFIHELATREDSMAIVRAVTGLGKSLGIATTAEGVETTEQLEILRNEGCTEVQGYLFSPPIPLPQIERMLTRNRLSPKAPSDLQPRERSRLPVHGRPPRGRLARDCDRGRRKDGACARWRNMNL